LNPQVVKITNSLHEKPLQSGIKMKKDKQFIFLTFGGLPSLEFGQQSLEKL